MSVRVTVPARSRPRRKSGLASTPASSSSRSRMAAQKPMAWSATGSGAFCATSTSTICATSVRTAVSSTLSNGAVFGFSWLQHHLARLPVSLRIAQGEAEGSSRLRTSFRRSVTDPALAPLQRDLEAGHFVAVEYFAVGGVEADQIRLVGLFPKPVALVANPVVAAAVEHLLPCEAVAAGMGNVEACWRH